MAMVISPESELGKEMAKWNKPYVYRPFPKMLYRAQRRPDGIVSVGESDDMLFSRGTVARPGAAEAFNNSCQKTVNSEDELRRELERGWRETPGEAMAFFESREKGVSTAAAHRAYEDRNMSDKAKAEASEADAATMEHVAEVPVKKRRRGRPAKRA